MNAEYFENGYLDEPTEAELQERWEAENLTPAEHRAIALELAALRGEELSAKALPKGPAREFFLDQIRADLSRVYAGTGAHNGEPSAHASSPVRPDPSCWPICSTPPISTAPRLD